MRLPNDNRSVAFTLAIALMLAMIELPAGAPAYLTYWEPDFALLVCYYWATNPTSRIALVVPWVFGFLFDVLNAEPMGLNGLIYVIVAYVGLNIPSRSNRPIVGYQLLGLLAVVIISKVLRLIVMQFGEFPVAVSLLGVLYSTIVTLVVWFIVVLVMDRWVAEDRARVSFS